MSVGLPSDDVAEDFKSSLEDLVDSTRAPITTLTIIAKENIEHASAICRALEHHIKTTPPNRKLPALYLLDSIVKNVGTPYTLFLSPNLYSTFMTAYSLVNGHTRQKLDEMLATWKQPNAGSRETKPVFPQDVTKPIEDALSRARNAAIEQNQRQAPRIQPDSYSRHPQIPPNFDAYRHSPIASQGTSSHAGFMQPYSATLSNLLPASQYPQVNQLTTPDPAINHMDSQASNQHHQIRPYQPPPPPIDLPLLHRDIAELVRNAHFEAANEPANSQTQGRLQTLMSLQLVLQQYHPPEELQKVRERVTEMQSQYQSTSSMSNVAAPPSATTTSYLGQGALSNIAQPTTAPRMSSPIDIQALMSSRHLASIIASAQKPPTSHLTNQTSNLQAQSPPTSEASDLIASLTRAGLLNGSLASSAPVTRVGKTPIPHPALARLVPANDVELTSISLKSLRTDLISILYDFQPNQCTTCGRRFALTDDGRAAKSKHYDWHFRTNQRISISSKRAQNRSWYVDELEWIKSQDDPEGALAMAAADQQDSSVGSEIPKTPFITVPTDQALANQPCPICQEKFVASYNDEVSDWVWMDAVRIADSRSGTVRVYHASCHRELKKTQSRENTPARTETPDSVLGKRKAVEGADVMQVKLVRV